MPKSPTRREFVQLALTAPAAAAFAGTAAAQTTPRRGGTMVMIVQPEPATLAHYAVAGGNIPMIATQVYEGLVTYDWDLKPQPNLAKSWDMTPDGKTITFHLQEGVTFHNGMPFTSADVQYSFMEVLKKFSPAAPIILKELESVDTPDPLTAVFHLANPAPYMWKALAARDTPIVCKALFEGTDVMSNPTANKPIGTGPFKFVSWDRGSSIRLDRNDKYWKPGLPYLNRVVARFIPDAATRSAALETGEVHFAAYSAVNYADLSRMKTNPILDMTTKGYDMSPSMSELEFNSHHPPFDKKEVRQAIAYAIDRQFIIDSVLYGYGKPATGPFSSVFAPTGMYTDQVKRFDVPDRIAIANKLLDDAGLPKKDDGMRFQAHLEINSFGEQWLRQGEYLKQALAQIGIDLVLRSEDTPTWLRRVYTNYDFDISEPFFSNGADPVIGIYRQYLTSQIRKGVTFVNATFYSNPEIDKIFAEAARELDPAKRNEMYHTAQKIIVEDSPDVWIAEVIWVSVFNRKLHDHTTGPLGTQQAFERAWLET